MLFRGFRGFIGVILLVVWVGALEYDAKFESAEHTYIGDHTRVLLFPTSNNNHTAGNYAAGNYTIMNARGLSLGTYGDIMSYADYFGARTIPAAVCSATNDANRQKAFLSVFDQLWLTNDQHYLNRIHEEIALEQTTVKLAQKINVEPSTLLWALSPTRYLNLIDSIVIGVSNLDHFNSCARMMYTVGHTMALQTARAAGSMWSTNPDQSIELLTKAYAMNAYSDHFLTDLFSTGHLRTPRKQLIEACPGVVSAAGTAKRMHDEDSYNGLFVSNDKGEKWFATGDHFLLDTISKDNLKRVINATQLSQDQIWNAFNQLNLPLPNPNLPLSYTPTVVNDARNTCPLYRQDSNGVLQIRSFENHCTDVRRLNNLNISTSCLIVDGGVNDTVGCGYREFVKGDCFGGGSSLVAAAEMVMFPPFITFDNCQHCFISTPSLLPSNSEPPTVPRPTLLFLLPSIFFQLVQLS